MWFKNATIYKIVGNPVHTQQLNKSLERHQFTPLQGLEMQRRGWAPNESGEFAYAQGRQVLLTMRIDRKLLPTSVVNEALKALVAEVQDREGYKPGRKQQKELKEQVIDTLLPKAFAVTTTTRVWIDGDRGLLVVDSASPGRVDQAIGLLVHSIEGLCVTPLRLQNNTGLAMTGWLAENEAPQGFNLDQDAELVGRGQGSPKVKYSKHPLEGVEIQNHIAGGKLCTRLAMTWQEKVSFVLTDSMTLKQITPLDVMRERAATNPDDDVFASGFALMTGEMGKLIDSLVFTFGGHVAEETNADDDGDDSLLEFAIKLVKKHKRVSISMVQRHLRIGYSRAARLIEAMETKGIVSPMDSSGNRTLLQGN